MLIKLHSKLLCLDCSIFTDFLHHHTGVVSHCDINLRFWFETAVFVVDGQAMI